MAYTSSWDETYPPGSELANKIDDIIRQFKLQLQERLESVLIDDMHADPWTLKDNLVSGGGSSQNGLTYNIPMCGWAWDGASNPAFNSNAGYIEGQNDFYAPIILPVGAAMTAVIVVAEKLTNPGIYVKLCKRKLLVPLDPEIIELGTAYSVSGGFSYITIAGSFPIDEDRLYWIFVPKTLTAVIRIHGAYITYNIPAI